MPANGCPDLSVIASRACGVAIPGASKSRLSLVRLLDCHGAAHLATTSKRVRALAGRCKQTFGGFRMDETQAAPRGLCMTGRRLWDKPRQAASAQRGWGAAVPFGQRPGHTRNRRGMSTPLHAVSTSVVVISSSAIAEANGQLLFVLNSQYSSGAIIWKRGPPSR